MSGRFSDNPKQHIRVTAPITNAGSDVEPIIGIGAATGAAAGSMPAADKAKLDAMQVPLVRLDFAIPGIIWNGVAHAAASINNAHVAQNFTVNSLTSILVVELRMTSLHQAAAAGVPQVVLNANIDSGAAFHPIAAPGGNNTGVAWFTAEGGPPLTLTGLTAGLHSIVIQATPTVNVVSYLRNLASEFLRLKITELNP